MLFVHADLVRSDRIVRGGTLVVEGDRIVDVLDVRRRGGAHGDNVDLAGCIVAPGFIDAHVHGAAGHDVLDGSGAVAHVGRVLPRWGVTAFSPTSIACDPRTLDAFLSDVAAARTAADPLSARVLPAHLESNFINPDYRGAQPLSCLRTLRPSDLATVGPSDAAPAFSARDILSVIDRHRASIAAITMAPEIEGGPELVRALVASGVTVSLGHSGATFEQATDAIADGARRGTHLFNRMSPIGHREPGLPGAILASDDVTAELICDGHHVHPATMRFAIGAKGPSRIMAITDGTAGSGLARGSRARLGHQSVEVGDVARLEDGTIAGSVATMNQALACLVGRAKIDLLHAVGMCATVPARELRLDGQGVLAPGTLADFVALDAGFGVRGTWIGGRQVYSANR